MERTDNTQRNRKGRMPWKSIVCLVAYLILFIGSGAYLLIDDTCRNDPQGIEKRCQVALSHYRG